MTNVVINYKTAELEMKLYRKKTPNLQALLSQIQYSRKGHCLEFKVNLDIAT